MKNFTEIRPEHMAKLQVKSTEIVNEYIENTGYTNEHMAHLLGMTRKTFAKRMKFSQWTKLEMYYITNELTH